MLNKLKKSNDQGFTIIEVMIVLAIAGLIILIVLLAVPALQRNGRNTAMKNNASSVAAGVSEFKSNNDGKTPNSVDSTNAPTYLITNTASGSAPATVKLQTGTTLTYTASPPAAFTTGTGSTIYILPGAKCVSSNYASASDVDTTAGAARGTAVIYPVEQSTGAPVGRCIDA